MKRNSYVSSFLLITLWLSILLPLLVVVIWGFTSKWSFPHLLPETLTMRGVHELFNGYFSLFPLLLSSMGLSTGVAFVSVLIGTMAARAFVRYNFKGKEFLQFISILPIIVPGTVLGMGIHIIFIKLGLNDTLLGVILVHTMCSLPYTIKIMTDLTALSGIRLEEQAWVLGAKPWAAFCYITIPTLLPGMISSACLSYITSFSQYFLTLIIGGGKVKTYSVVMVPFIQDGDRTIAGAYSIVFLISTALVFGIFQYLLKKISTVEDVYLI